jgi:hypothetical protein
MIGNRDWENDPSTYWIDIEGEMRPYTKEEYQINQLENDIKDLKYVLGIYEHLLNKIKEDPKWAKEIFHTYESLP